MKTRDHYTPLTTHARVAIVVHGTPIMAALCSEYEEVAVATAVDVHWRNATCEACRHRMEVLDVAAELEGL